MYFLSVILIGTIYPIFLEVISNEKISVGPPFYNKLIAPFLIIFLIFMSIGPKLHWIKTKIDKNKIQFFLLFVISSFISYLIMDKMGSKNLVNGILVSASLYLFFVTLKDFFLKRYSNFSQKISHFGFSLLILSILFNSIFSSEISSNLKVGDKILFEKGIITFLSIENKEYKNYQSIVGHFKIEDNKKNLVILKPELRIYNQPYTITSEADIKTTFYSDKFLVMNLVKGNEYFNVRYQVKSFMIWIWVSAIILSLGGIYSLLRKNYEK
tara:strand:- start:614 stop:1420 length:807 start_codon:yes stop_codon:yes gene_type:complete